MPAKKTGEMIPCCVCGTLHYRSANYLLREHKRMTCGNRECVSRSMMGEGNPFYGRAHDQGTIDKIRASKRARPGRKGGKKGYRHTPEARAAMSAALKRRWAENRDKMLAQYAHLRKEKARELLRYRRNFTPAQRRDWKDAACAWCGCTDRLILDHIIPAMCGGTNERKNAQTLCQPCNVWKMWHVDRRLFLAGLGQ